MTPSFETSMPHRPNHNVDVQQELVSAWLDDALDPQQCEQLCGQLRAPQDSVIGVNTAATVHSIGQVLRAQAVQDLTQQTLRTSRVLAAVRTQYVTQSLTYNDATNVVSVNADMPAANDVWFNWRAIGSAAAVMLALGVWWQLPADTDAVVSEQVAAQSPASGAGPDVSAVNLAAADVADLGASVVTDPRLEALLATHRQSGVSNAWPGAVGFVRNVAWTGGGQ